MSDMRRPRLLGAKPLRDAHELIELGARGAAGDGVARPCDARFDRRHEVGGVERGAGIEHDDLARRARCIVQRSSSIVARLGFASPTRRPAVD
jgi:hypothetical protein